MRHRLFAVLVVLGACKTPISYEPKVTTRFTVELTLGDLSVRRAELAIDLPEGYRQSSPGIHDAYFKRPDDKVYFSVVRQSPLNDLGVHDARPCGQYPGLSEGLNQLASERFGERGELELCETRDLDGPTDYSVRGSMPVEDNWIECLGHLDPVEREHRTDASNYTEKQREQVMAVCRSMHIVSLGPRISIDEQHRALRK